YKYHIWSQEIIDRLFNGIEYESEMNFLSKVLGNMRFTKKITNEHSFVTIHILVTLFIEEVSKELDIDLTQDKELFTNLSNHMFDILNNSYSQNIESQELKYVMEKNYSVVSAIKNNVYVFENYISRQLSMIEIGYLSLHILASLEKEKILKRELRVLLICNSGIGTSRLLKTRLDNHYVFNIVDILSVYELEIYDISNIDLIISTVQLDKDISVPYAQVGVHLNEQDLKIINSTILKIKKETSFLQKQNNIQKQDILQHIQPYFSGYKDLYEQVESLIQDYFRGKVEEEQKNLSDFLNEDMILLDEEANDWHQVIVKSIMPLEKKGMVTNHFKDEIIQSVENYGDYIMISDNVVFPHAGFEQGAKLTGVTFARFTTPTYISDPQKTIDMAFGLSASDNKKHVKALFTLVELVNNPDFKNKLMNAKEKKDIIHIIKEFESCQKEGK
ncbi:MAG: PTS sugar transporter subunit IIA, partial [Coprobacillus sp.]